MLSHCTSAFVIAFGGVCDTYIDSKRKYVLYIYIYIRVSFLVQISD